MVKKDGAETRRERISQIARDLQSAFHELKEKEEKEELVLSKFIAFQMFNMGLSEGKVMEYLRIIEKVGQCEIDTANDIIRKLLL